MSKFENGAPKITRNGVECGPWEEIPKPKPELPNMNGFCSFCEYYKQSQNPEKGYCDNEASDKYNNLVRGLEPPSGDCHQKRSEKK